MSLINKKSISVLIIILGLVGAYFVYRHLHPKYVPKPREEVTLTIIPGWNLRQVADYLVEQGFASTTGDVYKLTGEPAKVATQQQLVARDDQWWQNGLDEGIWQNRPRSVSFEGYLAPETVRFFAGTPLKDLITKFLQLRDKQFSVEMRQDIAAQGKSLQDVLTMASIVEKETKNDEDRGKVADILWRRLKAGMPLQLDSTVSYAVNKTGTVYTTDQDRAVDSPWNTYKYKGLPPGPICNPGLESIKAALNPEPNKYWYFLSGKDGKMYYAKTLEEHNANKKYL